MPASHWEELRARITACARCPRLVAHREAVAAKRPARYRDWDYWARPVPSFGDPRARLLVIGLAPAAHGANRTGRMFTGDGSGQLLMRTLHRFGFASRPVSRAPGDGLQLRDTYITAAARCAPPQNRPTAAELARCRPYLVRELDLLRRLRVVICLGGVAFEGYLRAQRERGHKLPRLNFGHAVRYAMRDGPPVLLASYHPSRQNTNTGRLTEAMFQAVFAQARRELDSEAARNHDAG